MAARYYTNISYFENIFTLTDKKQELSNEQNTLIFKEHPLAYLSLLEISNFISQKKR